MTQRLITTPHSPAVRVRRVLTWLAGIVCYGLLLAVIVLIARQIIVPPPAHRILLVRTLPLPEGLKAKGAPDWLEPGQSQFIVKPRKPLLTCSTVSSSQICRLNKKYCRAKNPVARSLSKSFG